MNHGYIPPPSQRLRSLPRLRPPRDRVPKLPPTNRIHQPPLLAPRHDHTKRILARADIVIALIAQTNHRAPDQIADAETLVHLNLVLLRGPDVLAADLALERLATHDVVDDEDLACCEARAQAGDEGEHRAVDFGEDGAAAA